MTIGFALHYVSYRYWLTRDEIVVREGILFRNERHIPYTRIQNIDLTRNPLHRMFDVAEARVETASGGKPEAVIRVLSMRAIDEMRDRVFPEDAPLPDAASDDVADAVTDAVPDTGDAVVAATTAETTGETTRARPASRAQPTTLLDLPLREVVMFGLISNRGMVVVAAAFAAVSSQMGTFDFDPDDLAPAAMKWLGPLQGLLESRAATLIVGGLLLIVAALVFMRLLSVGLAIFKLYGFHLTRRGDDLRAEFGLFTRISQTMPIHRIQLLTTRETRLHYWFKRNSIQIETAGGGSAGIEDDGNAYNVGENQWLAPMYPRAETPALIRSVLPEIDLTDLEWNPIEARAWVRPVRIISIPLGLLSLTAVILAIGFEVSLAWVLPTVAILVAMLLGWLSFYWKRWIAHTGYALSNHAVVFRSGWWGKRTSAVRYSKIQAVTWRQSPFDRRHRMASVTVDTAGAGRTGHGIDIPYLDMEVARELADRLTREADRREFQW